ncbi:MAG: hypothetical protein RLZZ67_525 [Candidatus Parcubacteria bacterium]|jgi:uncharacterized membrane protein YbaN (DUF454 family)
MNPYFKTILFLIGIGFVILGVIGLFIPIMQGILFLVIGVYILSLTSTRFKNWFDHHIAKFPRVKHHYEKHRGRVDRIFKKRGEQ